MPYCITLRSRTDARITGWYAGSNLRWSTEIAGWPGADFIEAPLGPLSAKRLHPGTAEVAEVITSLSDIRVVEPFELEHLVCAVALLDPVHPDIPRMPRFRRPIGRVDPAPLAHLGEV